MVDIKEILKRSEHFNKHVFKKKSEKLCMYYNYQEKPIFSYSIKKKICTSVFN
jgi:hypothetical protein